VVVALDGDEGVGSGRSIPAFDLLGGLDACASHLVRHGGHRAAAGCTIRREDVDAFRAAFTAHAAQRLGPDDFVRVARVDAVVAGDELGTGLAEELEALAPFGQENPEVALLVPAARLTDVRQMGEGKHIRFSVESGGGRARAVAFGMSKLPDGAEDGCFDATFGLELNEWNGAVEPRLVLRDVLPCGGGPIELAGELEDPLAAALLEADHRPDLYVHETHNPGRCRDRRGLGIAGTLASLVATGEPVLVVCADARARRKALADRLGGFAITSYAGLTRDPEIARPYPHLVALDPPADAEQERLLHDGAHGRTTHLCWGAPELAFSEHVHERDHDLRPALRALYVGLRDRGEQALQELHPLVAGRSLRVLRELNLVDGTAVVSGAPKRELSDSPSFVAYTARLEAGRSWLSSATPRAA
jgi:single-stranded-DNA-specific exonuclease